MKKIFLYFIMAGFLLSCGYAPPAGNYPQPSTGFPPQQQYPQNQYPQQQYPQQQVQNPSTSDPLPPRTRDDDRRDDDRRDRDDDRRYDDRRDRDDDRRRSSSRRDRCEDDEDCVDICSDIFRNTYDRRRCERLDEDDVRDMEEIFVLFESPDDLDRLRDRDLDALEKLIRVSVDPIEREIKKYRQRDSEYVLEWIAGNPDVAAVLRDSDDFEILEALLEEIDDDPVEAVGEEIIGNESFIEIAVETGNSEALAWIHDYFEEGSGSSDNGDCNQAPDDETERKCIFDKYCRAVEGGNNDDSFSDNARKDLAGELDEFEEIMEYLVGPSYEDDDDFFDYCDETESDGTTLKYRVCSKSSC